MRHKEKSFNERYLTTLLAVVLILTCVTLIWLGWTTFQSYSESKKGTERQMRIAELHGTIVHLDEVLTMSARMAAATGDLRWEQRYRRFEPTLNAAIKEAIVLAPDAYEGDAVAETDAANIALVVMENRAFDLIHEGRTDEAKAILFSDEYEKQKWIYVHGMTRFAEHSKSHLRLGDLRSTIIYLDEVLTMSARMAVATGDQRWEQRYHRFEPPLNEAIKEAIALTSDIYGGEAAAKTDTANIALVNMEKRSFERVRDGRTDEAKAILFSDEYDTQKRIYTRGMDEFADAISNVIKAEWKQEQYSILSHAMPALLLLPFLVVAWLVVFRAVAKWRAILITNNHLLARQSKELLDLNITLDRRVIERTTELSKTNESLKTEITERKQAEVALQERTERYELIAAGAYDAIWDWDVVNHLVYFSPRWKELRGIAPNQVIDREEEWAFGIHPDDVSRVMAAVQAHFDGKTECFEEEYQIQCKDGSWKWILDRGIAQHDADGHVIRMAGSESDITERKEAEQKAHDAQEKLIEQQRHQTELALQELEKVKEQLIRQTRLVAVGQVAASIAHELRNPLGAVRNAAYYMHRRLVGDNPKITQYLDIIDQEVDVSDRIINNLLEMTRDHEPIKQNINLGDVISEGIERANLDNGVQCHMEFDENPFMVCVDPAQLRQVLENLLVNARQSIKGDGDIFIRGRHSDEMDFITVQDTGTGVDADQRACLFEPLFTTKTKGTGLGLTICRQIIEKHGGSLDYIEHDKPGAMFQIQLPRTRKNTTQV